MSNYINTGQEKIKYPDRSALEKQIKKSLHYYKIVKDTMEAHETKAKSSHFRKNLLERQKVTNYQNEIDRLRGELNQATLRGLTTASLNSRIEELEKITKQIKK